MITAYREPDRATGRKLMQELIESVSSGVPRALVTPGRTLKKRAADVLGYFGRPGTSNGPTEAINGRLEHLPRLRPGLPEPDQLHRQILARDRRASDRNYTLDREEPPNNASHARTVDLGR